MVLVYEINWLLSVSPSPSLLLCLLSLSLGRAISIDVDTTSTVAAIKQRIKEKEGVPLEQQQLIFSGMTLADDRQLSSYNIQRESTVHLVIKVNAETTLLSQPKPDTPAHKQVNISYSAPQGPPSQGVLPQSNTKDPHGKRTWMAPTDQPVRQPPSQLQLTINTQTGKQLKFNVDSNESVYGLKQLIAAQEEIPCDQQVLICAGSQLQDGRLLCDYGITFNCTLQLIFSAASRMHLFVKTLNGHTFILYPSIYQTVADVKNELQSKENIDTSHHRIVFQGKHLDDDKTLKSCNLPSQCTVHMVQLAQMSSTVSPSLSRQVSMPILVRTLTGNTITLLATSTDRVRDIKKRLEEREGYPIDDINLVFGGKDLDNDALLSEYRIQQDSTLLVTFKVMPSMHVMALNMSTNEVIKVEGLNTSDRGRILQDKLEQILKITRSNLTLVYNGQVVNPELSLSQYSIRNGSTVQVFTKQPSLVSASVSTITGRHCHCQLYDNRNVLDMKVAVYQILEIPPEHQVLTCNAQILEDSTLLSDVISNDNVSIQLFTKMGIPILVLVRLHTGKTLNLRMESNNTVQQLKMAIQECGDQVPASQQVLHYRGVVLENHYCLGDYLIHDGATLLLMIASERALTVFVKTPSKLLTLSLEPSNSVEVLKLMVAQKTGMASEKLNVFFCGEVLLDNDSIGRYGLPNPCTLVVESK